MRAWSDGRGRALRGLLALGLALVLLGVLARAFVGDLYRIESASMEPGLRAGEWVLVRYDRSPPRRWELVVLALPGEEDAVVKRVVGLPRERVQLAGGDAWIDGARAPLSSTRPPPVDVPGFAWRPLASEAPGSEAEAAIEVRGEERALVVDALSGARALVGWDAPVRDDVPPASGRGSDIDASGSEEVRDLVLTVEARLDAVREGAELALGVRDGDELLWLSLESAPGTDGRGAGLARLRSASVADPFATHEIAFSPCRRALDGSPLVVRLAHVDRHVRVWIDGELRFDLPQDRVRGATASGQQASEREGPRAWLLARNLSGRLRPSLARDLHYLSRGRFAVDEPLQLGPDQLFVLGDNSGHSRDGRDFGPTELEQVVGRPVLVVWPPTSWRPLPPPGERAARAEVE